MRRCIVPAVFLMALCLGRAVFGDTAPAQPVSPELAAARRQGWTITTLLVTALRAGDNSAFPGINAWVKDFERVATHIDAKRPTEEWPSIDVDRLVTHNPNFWQAYYEVAPADPGLLMLHAALLLSDGEGTRASYLIVIAKQRADIPKEVQAALGRLLLHTQKAGEQSNRVVSEGTKLHDNKDYKGAIAKYREALTAWPQNGLAHYELGYSTYFQQLIAEGAPLPPPDSMQINAGKTPSPAVADEYARARRHDPFQLKAYQGDDQQVIRGFLALGEKGLPAWHQITAHINRPVDDAVLEQLADACQQSNNHDLALTIRQVLVARRGQGFAKSDFPFITVSLRSLAPGNQTERVLKRLAGAAIEVRQLIAPEPDAK
ncbi:MAG TPA: hypothetical protein VFG04_21420 [Planctomycetaceae bacterium]|jgi:hypothetical protein|nr:hypothetical protein [Planctomycetaceae bacterium]